MVKKFSNEQILNLYSNLLNAFKDDKKYIPVKIGFAISKNTNKLQQYVKEIENARRKIAEEYGAEGPDESGTIMILPENRATAQKELEDLASIEQEIEIRPILIEEVEQLELTLPQISAIDFMIEE